MARSERYGTFDFRDLRVLVVEDEEFARGLTCQVLKGFGCATVVAAENGNQAVDLLSTAHRSFGLIVCDFRMPRMNGIELLKRVRVGLAGVARDTAFAMLTSYSDKPIVGLAFKLDVDCFLTKPTTAANMRNRLQRVMSTDRFIKPPFDYHEVFIENVEDLEPEGPGADPIAVSQQARASGVPSESGGRALGGRSVRLADVRPGTKLVAPVKTSGGQILLLTGTSLDARTLDRLQNLAEIDPAVAEVRIE